MSKVKPLLVLLFLGLLIIPASATVGLGISRRDVEVTAYTSEMQQIELCRIYNTGNESLILSTSWEQLAGNMTVEGRIIPVNKTILPDENLLVYLEFSAPAPGNFSIRASISANPPVQVNFTGTGGFVLPAYDVYRNVTLIHEPPREVTVYPSHSEGGRLSLEEDLTVLTKTPVTIEAIPYMGYQFSHWHVNGVRPESNNTELVISPVENIWIVGFFTKIPAVVSNNSTDTTNSTDPGVNNTSEYPSQDDPVQPAEWKGVFFVSAVFVGGIAIMGLFYRERIQEAFRSGEVEEELASIREDAAAFFNRVRERVAEKVSELRNTDDEEANDDDDFNYEPAQE